MDPITINKGEVLILKADMMLSNRCIENLRNYILSQIKEGVVIIPNGFSYEIWKHDYCITQEDKR